MAAAYLVTEDSQAPPEWNLPEQPMSIDFHPTDSSVLAVGLIEGTIKTSRFTQGADHTPACADAHPTAPDSSCRALRFLPGGDNLLVAGADHSLSCLALHAGAATDVAWSIPDAHRDALSCVHVLDPNTVASADDSGAVKVWDLRQSRVAVAFDDFQDWVSDLATDDVHPEVLLATSGDGTLGAFDLRQKVCLGRTMELEQELLSVEVIKGCRKVICGTSEGELLIFNWGEWDGASDCFPGHPQSVETMLRLDASTVLTGSSDGLIRVVGIMPNKLYGLVGDHGGFPVERMRWSADRSIIGSISHDTVVRFWDVSYLHEDDGEDEEEEEGGAMETGAADIHADQTAPEILHHIRAQSESVVMGESGMAEAGGAGSLDEDDEEEWEDMDEDDDDDEEDGNGQGGFADGSGGGIPSGGGGGGRRGNRSGFKTTAEAFFADL